MAHHYTEGILVQHRNVMSRMQRHFDGGDTIITCINDFNCIVNDVMPHQSNTLATILSTVQSSRVFTTYYMFCSSTQCLAIPHIVMFLESSSFRRNDIAVIKPVTFHDINRTSSVVFKLVHRNAVVVMFVSLAIVRSFQSRAANNIMWPCSRVFN